MGCPAGREGECRYLSGGEHLFGLGEAIDCRVSTFDWFLGSLVIDARPPRPASSPARSSSPARLASESAPSRPSDRRVSRDREELGTGPSPAYGTGPSAPRASRPRPDDYRRDARRRVLTLARARAYWSHNGVTGGQSGSRVGGNVSATHPPLLAEGSPSATAERQFAFELTPVPLSRPNRPSFVIPRPDPTAHRLAWPQRAGPSARR
jgi:hypothetical protein